VRWELAIFATLGLAGVAMVAMTMAEVGRLDVGSDLKPVARSVRTNTSAVIVRANDGEVAATNVNVSEPADAHTAPRDPKTGKSRAAASSGLSLVRR